VIEIPDLDALFAELTVVGNESKDALTMIEWQIRTGHAIDWIRKRFRAAQMAGRLSCELVRRPGLDGKTRTVPAYRILPQ
jgi:hypothetical protein